MGVRYVTHIMHGNVYVSDQDDPLPYTTDDALSAVVVSLIDQGYAFTDEVAGWPPAAIVQSLKDKGLVQKAFIAITWVGPGEYRTYTVD